MSNFGIQKLENQRKLLKKQPQQRLAYLKEIIKSGNMARLNQLLIP